ncbi:MAG: hypothetical protein Kow0092_14890 [Deferrisomatales bacterium]
MGTPLTPEQRAWRRKWVVLLSALESLVQGGVKLAAALYTGSAALLADAIHSAADVVGSLLVWVGVRVASHRHPRFPFGLYKVENLLALGIGLAILYGAYEVFRIFRSPEAPLPRNVPAGIAVVLVAMALDFFWGRFETEAGRSIQSPGVEASGHHTLSDVYASAVVLAGLGGALFGVNLDRWAALAVAFLIAKIGLQILWDNLKVLLDISLPEDKLGEYARIASRQAGVAGVKAVRGRSAGSFRFLHVHLAIKAHSVERANAIARRVEEALRGSDETLDSVFVAYSHELPPVIRLVVPTDGTGTRLSEHFGKSTHLTVVDYERESHRVEGTRIQVNPFAQADKHRGIHLAEYLVGLGVDSVCAREDLHDKGPGLMLHRFGVDVRRTGEPTLEGLLTDYFGRSRPVFLEEGEPPSAPAPP